MSVLGSEFIPAAMNQCSNQLNKTTKSFSKYIRQPSSVLLAPVMAITMAMALSTVTLTTAYAKPLTLKRCQELSEEHLTLRKDPTVQQMQKGFEWIKENVKGDALLPIKQYLEVSDKLNFRCPYKIKTKNIKEKPPIPKLKDEITTNSIKKDISVKPEKKIIPQPAITKPEASIKKTTVKKSAQETVKPEKKSSDKAENNLLDGIISALNSNEEPKKSKNLGKSNTNDQKPAPKSEKPSEDNTVHPFF